MSLATLFCLDTSSSGQIQGRGKDRWGRETGGGKTGGGRQVKGISPTQAFSSPTTVPLSFGKLRTLVTKQAVSIQVPPLHVSPAMMSTSQKGAAISLSCTHCMAQPKVVGISCYMHRLHGSTQSCWCLVLQVCMSRRHCCEPLGQRCAGTSGFLCMHQTWQK